MKLNILLLLIVSALPSHATAWTFRRSVYMSSSTGATTGNFPAVDTTDATVAVACSNYTFASPYAFDIKEGSTAFPVIDVQQGGSDLHTRAYVRLLATHSAATVFTWDTSGSGGQESALILLFSVSNTSAPGADVKAASTTTPSQTTGAADTLVLTCFGAASGAAIPTAVSAGFTSVFGSFDATATSSHVGYKIEAVSGAVNAPAWTYGGSKPTVIGFMLVPSAAPVSAAAHHRVSQ